MRQFFIGYTDRDGDGDCLDWFVTAPDALTAFVMWRAHALEHVDAADLGDDDVQVFIAPGRTRAPEVHAWNHGTCQHFPLNLDNLATKAVLAALNKENEHA